MFFWWICWGESGLPILFLCHLRPTSEVAFKIVHFFHQYLIRIFSVRFIILTKLFQRAQLSGKINYYPGWPGPGRSLLFLPRQGPRCCALPSPGGPPRLPGGPARQRGCGGSCRSRGHTGDRAGNGDGTPHLRPFPDHRVLRRGWARCELGGPRGWGLEVGDRAGMGTCRWHGLCQGRSCQPEALVGGKWGTQSWRNSLNRTNTSKEIE